MRCRVDVLVTSTPDHGPPQLGALIVLEDVATGTRGSFKRARRRDNLAALNLAAEEYQALFSWGVAAEKIVAGQGLGPMPWERDGMMQKAGEALPAQMRALSSAEWHRIGTQAAGQVAHPVLCWVVLSGGRLDHYDLTRRWRERTSYGLLCGAAERMAEVYGFASRRRESGPIKTFDGGRN